MFHKSFDCSASGNGVYTNCTVELMLICFFCGLGSSGCESLVVTWKGAAIS